MQEKEQIIKEMLAKITKNTNLRQGLQKQAEEAVALLGLETREQMAMFFAQLAVESCAFRFSTELATGEKYEMRKDLGNTKPGDGPRFKGRGFIQVTGRYNYEKVSKALGVDFVNKPWLLAEPEYRFLSAVWFWREHNLKDVTDVVKATKIINGGLNAIKQRTKYYELLLEE
jgi:putative chitinase